MPSNTDTANNWNRSEIGRKWRSETRKKYRAENREKINAQMRAYYANNKNRYKDSSLKQLYGITLAEKQAMALAQNGCCKICNRSDQKLVVDHNHATGRVRGLLCGRCNSAIGILGEDPETLKRAITYVSEDVNCAE